MNLRFNTLCCALLLGSSMAMAQQQTSKKPPVKKALQSKPSNPMAEIAESHINGNVPVSSDFDRFLKRDLTAYFTKSIGKRIAVEYQFLREGATQTGISYPKYYLWVKIRNGKKLIEEGAVRVAAIDQKQFDITHYLSKATMKQKPEQIDEVFPLPVGDKIRQRLR